MLLHLVTLKINLHGLQMKTNQTPWSYLLLLKFEKYFCSILTFIRGLCPLVTIELSVPWSSGSFQNEPKWRSVVRVRLGRPQDSLWTRRPAFLSGSSSEELDHHCTKEPGPLSTSSRVSSGRGRVPAPAIGRSSFLGVLLGPWAPDSLGLGQGQSFLWSKLKSFDI